MIDPKQRRLLIDLEQYGPIGSVPALDFIVATRRHGLRRVVRPDAVRGESPVGLDPLFFFECRQIKDHEISGQTVPVIEEPVADNQLFVLGVGVHAAADAHARQREGVPFLYVVLAIGFEDDIIQMNLLVVIGSDQHLIVVAELKMMDLASELRMQALNQKCLQIEHDNLLGPGPNDQ